MADPFSQAKHRLLDRAMRDGRLTPASRLVFYEIIQHVNRVSGDAWPSEARLANRLQIDVKTVKRALPPLKLCGYIEVKKTGRHNTYRRMFDGPPNGDKLSPIDQMAPGDKLSRDRRQIVPSTGDKNGPVTSPSSDRRSQRSKRLKLRQLIKAPATTWRGLFIWAAVAPSTDIMSYCQARSNSSGFRLSACPH